MEGMSWEYDSLEISIQVSWESGDLVNAGRSNRLKVVRCKSQSLGSVFFRPKSWVFLWSWLGTQNLGLSPDLLNQNLQFYKVICMSIKFG